MNPWGQPQQPYNPAMAAYYQQQQQAAAYGYQQQQPYQQPQYQPVPGYPPQPQYPYAQPGYAYPPQQTYGAAPAYNPQPVVPAAPVAAPPAPPAPAPAPVAVELPEGAKAPMNVFVGKLPLDVHESCVEAPGLVNSAVSGSSRAASQSNPALSCIFECQPEVDASRGRSTRGFAARELTRDEASRLLASIRVFGV